MTMILSGYWCKLWNNHDFTSHKLRDCVNIIHFDIVEIWNLNDEKGVGFTQSWLSY